ncbi:hypothetical protein AKJ09_11365 [Labilithrix luteola]|uniref:Uncharacterized protein n=1 Tax=Labilithrix luteola TaxID=1391654 RepID=A0A0K1QGA8_9BACT|nr:hypothetical protein [Labilithrix luteola]AKV04702.1 hypothetical protein AKJ09_11365 [Labilithrix luteola]
MKRKTLLLCNGVALATLMLATVAHADDSKDMKGSGQTQGSDSSSPSTSGTSGTPGTSGSSGAADSTTVETIQTEKVTTVPPTVGTTTTTQGEMPQYMGSPQVGPQERDVTVYRKTRPNIPLLTTGGLLLAGTYTATAIVGGTSDRQADKNLYIPVVGPWLNLADRQCDGCAHESGNIALVILSGIGQGLGAGMTIASFLIPQKVAAATITAGNVKMNVVPTSVGKGGAGLGAVGTF